MTLMCASAIWPYLSRLFTRDTLAPSVDADYTSASLNEKVAASLDGLRLEIDLRVVDAERTSASFNEEVVASLDEHYPDIDLRVSHLWDGTMQRLRKRAVADRVRILRIGPYFVCDALDSSRDHPFQDTTRLMRSLLARFSYIEEYHILWHERPTMTLRQTEPKYDMSNTLRLASTFLAIPFSSSPYLRALNIELSLDKAEHLFLPSAVLPRLEEFRLCIRDDHPGDLRTAEYTLAHHISQFLNNHRRTLSSLTFESSLNVDLSVLFFTLGFFAHLSNLALCIPTSKPHLGDPSALKGFLDLHRDTVEHLSLRGFRKNQAWARMDVGWLSACLSGVPFSVLHTLSVGTSFIPLDAVMPCIQKWAVTLTTVDITGEYLGYEDVDGVLCALAGPRLGSLSIAVTCLCPELVDKLAECLPGLTKLHLRIQSIAPHRHEVPSLNSSSRKWVEAQESHRRKRFCEEMGIRTYEQWKLEDVGIWKFTSKLQYQRWCVDAVCGALGQG